MKYVGIVGGTYFHCYDDFLNKLAFYLQNIKEDITFVVGDRNPLVERFCLDHQCSFIRYLPDWEKYGKEAAYKRNVKLVAKADFILVFDSKEFKRTKLIKKEAKRMGRPIKITKLKYEGSKKDSLRL